MNISYDLCLYVNINIKPLITLTSDFCDFCMATAVNYGMQHCDVAYLSSQHLSTNCPTARPRAGVSEGLHNHPGVCT